MRLPDFVVIGAAKAGTTSLYALLDRHPGIFMPRVKEPEFFARDDHFARGIASYAAGFEAAGPDQLVGEASTLYSLAPLFGETAARMAAHIPKARLIYVMRQPVDRAYSYYVQILKNYQNVTGDPSVNRSFEEFIDPRRHLRAAPRDKVFSPANAHLPDTPELCLAGSDYVAQIEAYLAHFPREQMLFLKFEDFVRDRQGALRQITDFLEVDPLAAAVFEEDGVTRNVAETHFRDWGDRIAVDNLRRKAGGVWSLRRVLPQRLRRRLKKRLIAPGTGGAGAAGGAHVPPKMLPETRAALQARYAAQTERLAGITGLDFSDWGL